MKLIKKFLLWFAGFLLFNRQQKTVRGSIIMIVTNLLVVAAVLFSVEIILIFLGVGDIFLPLTYAMRDTLAKALFR